MSEATIWAAINAQFATLPHLDESKVAWPNRTFVPEAEKDYIAISMPSLLIHQIATGVQGVLEYRGVYQVLCNWPMGTGLEDVTAQRDAIRALFPVGLTLATSDGYFVKFFAPDAKPLMMDGAWLRAPVQCPWLLHEVTA